MRGTEPTRAAELRLQNRITAAREKLRPPVEDEKIPRGRSPVREYHHRQVLVAAAWRQRQIRGNGRAVACRVVNFAYLAQRHAVQCGVFLSGDIGLSASKVDQVEGGRVRRAVDLDDHASAVGRTIDHRDAPALKRLCQRLLAGS